jgi:hypothetical protein
LLRLVFMHTCTMSRVQQGLQVNLEQGWQL